MRTLSYDGYNCCCVKSKNVYFDRRMKLEIFSLVLHIYTYNTNMHMECEHEPSVVYVVCMCACLCVALSSMYDVFFFFFSSPTWLLAVICVQHDLNGLNISISVPSMCNHYTFLSVVQINWKPLNQFIYSV